MEAVRRVLFYPIREDDSLEMRRRKKIFMGFYAASAVGCGCTLVTVGTRAGEVGCWIMLGVIAVAVAHLVATRTLTDFSVEMVCYAGMVVGLIFDYNTAASQMERFWPAFVILIDILLVCRIRDRVAKSLVVVIVLWLITTSIEGAFRFGLYDLGGTASAASQRSRLTDCASPPCADVMISAQNLIIYLFVFLLDFYFTRGFSKTVVEEKERMETAVEAAQYIASALAAFDLDGSRRVLVSTPELPERLSGALMNILSNLESYKEFLPQSCLPVDADDVGDGRTNSSGTCSVVSRSTIVTNTPTTAESTLSAIFTQREDTYAVHQSLNHDLKKKAVTLTVANIKDFLPHIDTPEISMELQSQFVSCCLQVVREGKGVIDGFLGDHVFSSYNAVRSCASHGDNALSSALKLVRLMSRAGSMSSSQHQRFCLRRGSVSFGSPTVGSPTTAEVNVGVVGGKALCGDMGCPGMRRFTILGGVTNWGVVVERLCRAWGCAVLCDANVRQDCYVSFPLRLIEQTVVFRKKNRSSPSLPHRLYEATGKGSAFAQNEEWMYELQNNTHWECYNEALETWVGGDPDTALTHLAPKSPTTSQPSVPNEVLEAHSVLAKRIRSGITPRDPVTYQW